MTTVRLKLQGVMFLLKDKEVLLQAGVLTFTHIRGVRNSRRHEFKILRCVRALILLLKFYEIPL